MGSWEGHAAPLARTRQLPGSPWRLGISVYYTVSNSPDYFVRLFHLLRYLGVFGAAAESSGRIAVSGSRQETNVHSM